MKKIQYQKIQRDLSKGILNYRKHCDKLELNNSIINGRDIYSNLLNKFSKEIILLNKINIFNQARTSPLYKLSDFLNIDKKLIKEII